jgi:hypothetical protein
VNRLGCGLLLVLGLLTTTTTLAQAPSSTLYVFVHGAQKAHALEKLLEDELGNVDVTVFGRVADLKSAVQTLPPDALLARPPVLAALSMKPALSGLGPAGRNEALLIVSVDVAAAGDLSAKVIGAVDLLGRKEMPRFVADVLHLAAPPKLQPVTKQEDLLPLLQLKTADVVLVNESAFDEMRRRSTLDLKTTRVDGAVVGLPALAVVNGRGSDVKARCLKLSAVALTSLGLVRFEEER